LTRSLSRGVIADCNKKSRSESTYAIVGNPGIGKSWTLIYALQQALLYENVCVLFSFQKSGDALVCIRRNHKIYVWINRDQVFRSDCTSALFDNSNVLVLLDPREAKNGGANFAIGNRMLIYAASNNAKHFTSDAHKTMAKYQHILSPYSDNELLVALNYMQTSSGDSLNDMFSRRKKVGNLPRYLLSADAFDERLQYTEGAVTKITKNDLKTAVENFDGIVSDSFMLSGSIFSVHAKLTDENGSIGYDGQEGVNYFERIIGTLCEDVQKQVIKKGREYILSFWGIVDNAQLGLMGKYVEDLFWNDLQDKTCWNMKQFKMNGKTSASNTTMFHLKTLELPTQYKEECKISDLSETFSTNNCICRMERSCVLLDFAGPGRQVFQITVSGEHSLKKSGLEELFLACGLIVKKGKTFVKAENITSTHSVDFYWVIPQGKKKQWSEIKGKTINVKAHESHTKEQVKILKDVLDNYVNQYVLIMDSKEIVNTV
jgi:hypothetical protein